MSFSGLVDQQHCYVLLKKYCVSAMTQPSHHRWFCVRPEWWRTVGTFTQHCESLMPSSVEVILVTVVFHFSCLCKFGVGGGRTDGGSNLSVEFRSVCYGKEEVFHVKFSVTSFPFQFFMFPALFCHRFFLLLHSPLCPTPFKKKVGFFFQSVSGITKTGSSTKTPRQSVSRLKDRSYTIWVSWLCSMPYRTALKL